MRGRVIAESLRVGAVVKLAGVEWSSVSRHDVSAGTRPGGAVRSEDGAGAGQPPVWTFVDFACSDDLAETVAGRSLPPSSARVAGTRTSTSATTRSWSLPIESFGTDAATQAAATRNPSTADVSECRSTSSTGSSRFELTLGALQPLVTPARQVCRSIRGVPLASVDVRTRSWVAELGDDAASIPGRRWCRSPGSRRGEPPWLLRLSNSDIDEVVVRVGDESSVALLGDRDGSASRRSPAPGSPVLGCSVSAIGGPDAPDVFALVMSRVPGTSRSSVEPSTARLRALGEAVAIVHAAPVPTSPHLPVRRRPVEPVDFDAARRSEPARALLVEAENVLRRIPMPDHEPVFVHGDFWHGNTMWVDDQLTGIVDWECAGIGHPGIDLGMQRCDAALVVGPSGADACARRLRIGDRPTRPPTSPTGTSPAALDHTANDGVVHRRRSSGKDAPTWTRRPCSPGGTTFLAAALDRMGRV